MTKHKRPAPRDDARARDPKSTAIDVASLINERRKIEEWIAALNAKRDQTPPHVFTRVQGDYDKRLRDVAEGLASHTGSLAQEQAALKKRLDAIDEDIKGQRDERAEIELRAHVGELAASAVDAAYKAADADLAKLAADRDAIEADLQRVTEFFAAAGGGQLAAPSRAPGSRSSEGFDELSFLNSVVGENSPRRPAEPHPPQHRPTAEKPAPVAKAATPPPAANPVEPPLAAAPPARVSTPAAPAPPATPSHVDPRRTGELSSISQELPKQEAPKPKVEEPPKAKVELLEKAKIEEEPPKQPEKPAAMAIEREEAPLGEEPPARPVRSTIAMQQASMTIEPEDGIVKNEETAPSLLDGIAPKAKSGEKPFAANVASNNPLSLKSSAPAEVKTLKCRECGAMNDPTEWYCERCGAELSG